MARYMPRYQIQIRHDGLHKYRMISGTDRRVVEEKARSQMALWDAMWERKSAQEEKRAERERALLTKEAKIREAATRTGTAQALLNDARNILKATLTVDDVVEWDSLKSDEEFSEERPAAPTFGSPPLEPAQAAYKPTFDLLDRLFHNRRQKKLDEAHARFTQDFNEWKAAKLRFEASKEAVLFAWEEAVEAWEKRREAFEQQLQEEWAAVDSLKTAYERGEPQAIEEYVDLVLSNSDYPEWFNRDWRLGFEDGAQTLIINYRLPDIVDLPCVTEVRYVASRNAFEEKTLSKGNVAALYDDVIYQIILRTLHEVFEATRDVPHVKSVALNGYVEFTDPATGKDATNCICSIQVLRTDFEAISLDAIEPKACFKGLKGVSAARLDRMAPVAPLMILDSNDARFVESKDIASHLDDSQNLAAMDWKDFEHLIRQVFEAEFSSPDCEVKVTQGSRDGGVDAIAFDPDPIRGGKIVIQAKRYVHTVGVEAVRDLYGTVHNEGASKGILVTTSQFGPDARKFAAGKPLALIDGPNLLHLLQRQGVKGHIDLARARDLLRS